MVRIKEEKTKQLGKVTPSLNKKLVDYCKLIRVNKIDLLEELIAKELEGKVLDNTFIVPEKPYYFNLNELITKGTVEASTKKPSSELYNQIIIKQIPNNFDVLEEDLKTCCYDKNSKLHRGIINFSYMEEIQEKKEVGYDEDTEEVKYRTINRTVVNTVLLLFDYSSAPSGRNIIFDVERPSLRISIVPFNELPILLDNDSNSEEIKIKFEKLEHDLAYDSLKGMLSNPTLWKYNNNDVINYFHLEKNLYHSNNILKAVFCSSAEYIEEALKLLDNLIYRTVELYVENKVLAYKIGGTELSYEDKASATEEDVPIKDKSINESFEEAVVDLDFYNEVQKYYNDNPEKVYDIFINSKYGGFENKYTATYDRLMYYINSILEPNEEDNVYTLINAFPFDAPLFKDYDYVKKHHLI